MIGLEWKKSSRMGLGSAQRSHLRRPSSAASRALFCHGSRSGVRVASRMGGKMAEKKARDVEKLYTTSEFVAKLRRLAEALEAGERFTIQIAGERVYVPARARYNIEHERGGGEEEIEFQVKWSTD